MTRRPPRCCSLLPARSEMWQCQGDTTADTQVTDRLDDDEAVRTVYSGRLTHEFGSMGSAFLSSWPEVAHIAGVSTRMGGGDFCVALWYGEALRASMQRAHGALEAVSQSTPLDVDLDSCPIVRYRCYALPALHAMDSEAWVRRGCLEKQLTRDEAAMVDDWISRNQSLQSTDSQLTMTAADEGERVAADGAAEHELLRHWDTSEGQPLRDAWRRYLRRTVKQWQASGHDARVTGQ